LLLSSETGFLTEMFSSFYHCKHPLKITKWSLSFTLFIFPYHRSFKPSTL
jgi:hypothetical protein